VTGINGFDAQVSLAIAGLPTGVSISPANPQVTPGTPLQIAFTAASTVTAATVNLTVTGASGSLSHSQTLSLIVKAVPPPSLSRTRYVRTDAPTAYSEILNLGWTVFDSNTKRFFVSDPSGNQIVVLDAKTETQIASIPVPGAYGIDEAPGQSLIYAGTEIGDVYTIDPVGMKVTHRYLASQIGPYGYQAYAVRALATGQLALLGGQGGIPSVDGYGGFAIWNPAANSIVAYGSSNSGSSQANCVRNIGFFGVTGDHSLIVEGSIDSDDTLCTVNPATGEEIQVSSDVGFLHNVTPTPDGNLLLVPDYISGGTILVFNAKTLTQTSSFPVAGDVSSTVSMMASADSKTLYIAGGGFIYAYNIATGQLIGWLPGLMLAPVWGGPADASSGGPQLGAVDATGLIVGPMDEGVGFLDTAALQTGSLGTQFANAYVTPATGPAAGGTQIQWNGSNSGTIAAVYLGSNQASDLSASTGAMFNATTPAGNPGLADVYTLMKDGGEQIVPEGFSYGPAIVEAAPNTATSEGGGTGILYGYGFGSTAANAPIPAGLEVSVGGKPATITAYAGDAYGLLSPPFPLEAIAYTIPAGVSGQSADIVVTSPSGSTTLTGGMSYLPSVRSYPLPGAQLAQGVYDSKRNLYYFTDASKIQVFSRNEDQWQAPISVPAAPAGTTHRLWGIALSQDGSKLAVSDASAAMIYVLDPDTPASIQSFPVPGPYAAGNLVPVSGVVTYPAGLAISNTGMVYYTAFIYGGDGFDGFFKLDTGSGAVTDYGIVSFGDAMLRDAISSDNVRVFFNNDGSPFTVDTASDAVFYALSAPGCCYGDYDLSLSSNQTQLEATSYLYDADLNAESYLVLNDRDSLNIAYVYGVKMNSDGSLMFQPSTNGIDVFDGRLGTLRARISLPVALSENYDALVSDGADNILVAITDVSGDGVAVLDLSSLSEPAPLPYTTHAVGVSGIVRQGQPQARAGIHAWFGTGPATNPGVPLWRVPHAVNPILPGLKAK
jgi:hypothetical protein